MFNSFLYLLWSNKIEEGEIEQKKFFTQRLLEFPFNDEETNNLLSILKRPLEATNFHTISKNFLIIFLLSRGRYIEAIQEYQLLAQETPPIIGIEGLKTIIDNVHLILPPVQKEILEVSSETFNNLASQRKLLGDYFI